ncbi:uncharacterized protein [Nicotiana sylvestris]|uniref:uncharacterized protein n=1 Tax=Nicotiana sylvestris TaxID=4096 RepID=UPI00388C7B69
MGIVETNGVDFAAFCLSGSAKKWWRDYCLARLVGSPTLTWDQFSQLFLEKFLPVTHREEYRRRFERLQQGSVTVTQYEMRFCPRASSSSQHQSSRAMVLASGVSPPTQPARGSSRGVRSRGQAAIGGCQCSCICVYTGGRSIMVDRVYHACVVIIGGLETHVDLIRFDMVDFDVILGMDWLSPYHVILDCHAKTMNLALPGLPHLECRGTPDHSTSKANVVVDALSRNSASIGSLAYIPVGERSLALDVQALANQFVRLDISEPDRVLACTVIRSSLFERIRDRQYDDPHLLVLRDTVRHGGAKHVIVGDDGVLRMQGCICVPNVDELHELILDEAYSSRYSIHLGVAKMQKSYADCKVRDVAFMVGERVLLRVLPMKGVMRFGKKGKLRPRFIGPFEILDRVGEVAYRLALPLSLSVVHPVFHVSMLWKYHDGPSHVLDYNTVPLDKDLTYEDEPVAILDRQVRELRSKKFPSIHIQWRGQLVEAATW